MGMPTSEVIHRKAGFVIYLGVHKNPVVTKELEKLGCEVVPCGDPRWAIIRHPEAHDDGYQPIRTFDPCELTPD
jgi:hypothetical protein